MIPFHTMRIIFYPVLAVIYIASVLVITLLRAVIVLMGLIIWAAAALAAWLILTIKERSE